MSGTPGPSANQNGTPKTPKAIANLAKRPSEDVTRQGTSKMKFTPVLPARRKKEEPKPETKVETPTRSQDAGGHGRGVTPRGRGRGVAPGGAPREMVATGPLALGPTMTGSSAARRAAAPRSNFAPVTPRSLGPASNGGTVSSASGVAATNAPSLKREPSFLDAGQKLVEIEADMYSDPDEGVEIIDVDDVRRMDWMAPESLRKEKVREKKKRAGTVKRETSRDNGKVKAEPQDILLEEEEAEENQEVDHANALDLSESEEEEELEDIFNDFALQEDQDMDINARQEKLYFFQFPEPFPIFVPPQSQSRPHSTPAPAQPQSQDVIMKDTTATLKPTDKDRAPERSSGKGKKVSFAPDVKPPVSGASTPRPPVDGTKEESPTPTIPVDGVIGRLEIHQSGAVKVRLENGILLDVTAATQPSFLQHAVHVDMKKKRLSVIGEINRRFVVSPNIDALLEALEVTDGDVAMEVDPGKMEESLAGRGKTK